MSDEEKEAAVAARKAKNEAVQMPTEEQKAAFKAALKAMSPEERQAAVAAHKAKIAAKKAARAEAV